MENKITEGGDVINHNTVSLLNNQRTRFVAASRRWGSSLSFTFYPYGCPISTSSHGYRSLLGFSVRYNGVIRNKTEKTKETAGTRAGFWLGPATCWCYRKAYASIRDHGRYTRTSVHQEDIMDSWQFSLSFSLSCEWKLPAKERRCLLNTFIIITNYK